MIKPKQLSPIRLNQVGSFYNFPNWRYLVYSEPSRADLAYCRRKPQDGSACLGRYLQDHEELLDRAHTPYALSSFFSKAVKKFNDTEKQMFFKLFKKKLKTQGERQIFIPTYKEDSVLLWNAKYIDLVTDEPLKNFLYHTAKIKYSANYEFAVRYRHSAQHQRNFCVIGYCIFAGLSDTTIAGRYKLYPGQVRALREIFFDFTNAPTDVVARAAYFTQLTDNQIISDTDRRYYKIIGSLGELGLKADADPTSLSLEEKEKLNAYLADSMVDNVTSLYFTIEDKKDALAYNTVINNLASFFIKKEEINYYRSKVKHLDASTARIVNERQDYDTKLHDDDIKAMELITQLALKENSLPEYKIITELK
jgi:hypothetical protein